MSARLSQLLRAADVAHVDIGIARSTVTPQAQAHGLADPDLLDLIGEGREATHRLAVSSGDDVAEFAG